MLRQAQIAKYLNLLYEDAFQDWQKKRHDQLLDIARHAMALQKFRAERMPPGATTLETSRAGGGVNCTLKAALSSMLLVRSDSGCVYR